MSLVPLLFYSLLSHWNVFPLSTSAAHYLHSRSWKGLEQQLGETPVQPKAAEGRSGLPVEYDDEPKLQ